ncbi:MAG: hypothetical protein GXP37_00525, partial [Chloroflexi bacterium]|nr:hypothetical protein [Chloroflexota bacterium]
MNSIRSKLGTFATIIIAVLLLAGYAGGDVSASSLSGGGAPAASGPGVVQPTTPTEPIADLGGANSPAKSDCCSQESISGVVWNDANSNKLQDESNAGFANVTVNLYQDGTLISTTQTESGTTGYYIFDNLPTGTYVVDVDESTLPAGAQLTTDNEPLTVSLSCCNHSDTADFGYI